MQTTYVLYKHTCLKTNIVYIGITSKPINIRWNNGNGYKDNIYFYADILRYGWYKGFKHEVLKTNILTFSEACQLEDNLILYYLNNKEYLASLKNNRFGLKLYNRQLPVNKSKQD